MILLWKQWRKLSDLTQPFKLENDNIFHIMDQIKVLILRRKSGMPLFKKNHLKVVLTVPVI